MNREMIEELCKLHTGLNESEIDAIIRMSAGLPGLAAGSAGHADYFIDVPCRNPSEVVVVAWASSTISLYDFSTVGYIIQEDAEPAVFRSLRLGIETEELKAVTMASTSQHFVAQSTKPIFFNGRVIGVLIAEREYRFSGNRSTTLNYTRRPTPEELEASPFLRNIDLFADYSHDGIVIVNESGTVVYRNAKAARIYAEYGYEEDIWGRNYRKVACHATLMPGEAETIDDTELSIRGRYYRIEQRLLEAEGQRFLMAVLHNITAERQADQARAAYTASVQEAHHRIKNSLNMIYGLLDMQKRRCGSRETAESLQSAMNRILSIADAYNTAALEPDGKISIVKVISRIRDQFVMLAASTGKELNITIEGNDISVPAALATPIALVVNELLQNAYKHAFPGRQQGNVHISISNNVAYPVIAVGDDGVGAPEKDVNKGMGFRIIEMLVQNELHGSFRAEFGPEGTKATFGFVNERN